MHERESHFLYTFYHTMGLQRYIILRGRRPKKDYISVCSGSGKDIIRNPRVSDVGLYDSTGTHSSPCYDQPFCSTSHNTSQYSITLHQRLNVMYYGWSNKKAGHSKDGGWVASTVVKSNI